MKCIESQLPIRFDGPSLRAYSNTLPR